MKPLKSTFSNSKKKLLVTSASLLVTSALLVVTMFAISNKAPPGLLGIAVLPQLFDMLVSGARGLKHGKITKQNMEVT